MGHVTGEDGAEVGEVLKGLAADEVAGGVDGFAVVFGAEAADGVEVFEGEADGIEEGVAAGAGGFFAMGGELFTEGEFLLAAFAFIDRGDALGCGWGWGAEDVFEEEFAAFDGGSAGGGGGDGEDAAVGEDAAAGSALERDFLQFVAFDAGEVVVFGEAFVGEGVVGVEEVEDGEVFFDEVGEEGFGFAPEVRLDFVEVFEAGVVGVEVFEVAKLEPLAGEVFGEGLGTPVGEHAVDGGGEVGTEFGFGGELEEFFVWRSGPEEVG